MRLTIHGKVPSKKNSRNLFVRAGRICNIPSKAYADWEKEASVQIIGKSKIHSVDSVRLSFFVPDNRRRDLTNMAESVMDLLVSCEIIDDDAWQFISHIELICEGIDRKNPRVEIWIKEQTT